MNAAELTACLTFLGCAIAAGVSAALHRAGWFTPLFVLLGAGLGFAGAWVVARMAYALLDTGNDRSKFVALSQMLACTLLPLLTCCAAILGTAALVAWGTRFLR